MQILQVYTAPRAVSIAEDSIRMMSTFATPEMHTWMMQHVVPTEEMLCTRIPFHPRNKVLMHVSLDTMKQATRRLLMCMPSNHSTFHQPSLERKLREVLLKHSNATVTS